jgi:glycosyltransferase involved in cell wall biosynthesis
MNLSVIISTYNGAKKLPVILNSLLKQTHKSFELLVVVDGSSDETMDLLKEWKNKFYDFKIIYQENKGRAAVRNTGVKNSKGELLLFFDDDLIVQENCVKDHLEYQDKTNFENIFVGEILDEPIETADNKEFIRYKKYLAKAWYKNMYRKERRIEENIFDGNYYMAGGNFSLTKKIFDQLGGLDESLNRSEDFEFAIRAKAAGVKIILADKYATVIHKDNNNNFKDWIVKARIGQINSDVVYAKDKLKFKEFGPPEKTIGNFIKRMIFKSLANKFAYMFMVSNSRIKKIIPGFFLYKVYDLIIAANSKYYPKNVSL